MKNKNGPFNEDTFLESEFIRIRDTFFVNCAIETGAYQGVTTKWLGANFAKVYSIELKETNYNKAKENLKGLSNIVLYQGNSAKLLKKVINKVNGVFIVFLDAHWYDNPVLRELEAIRESKKFPILVIHDFKVPDRPEFGYDKYPDQGIIYEWDWIKDKVDTIYGAGNYTYYYNTQAAGAKRGCVFIVPNKEKLKQNGKTKGLVNAINKIMPFNNSEDRWVKKLKNVKPEKKYSQYGEESYLNFILQNIGTTNKYYVDFGAGDGHKLSNTRLLKEEYNWTGLMMDGDNKGNNEVKKEFITAENICNLFEKYNVPHQFDLLSIDIDGNDFWVLKELLKKYSPRLIIAEFNGTIPANESRVMKYNPEHSWGKNDYYGFSFKAGKKLAEECGYRVIFQNGNLNMYLLRSDLLHNPDMRINVTYKCTQYHKHLPGMEWVTY